MVPLKSILIAHAAFTLLYIIKEASGNKGCTEIGEMCLGLEGECCDHHECHSIALEGSVRICKKVIYTDTNKLNQLSSNVLYKPKNGDPPKFCLTEDEPCQSYLDCCMHLGCQGKAGNKKCQPHKVVPVKSKALKPPSHSRCKRPGRLCNMWEACCNGLMCHTETGSDLDRKCKRPSDEPQETCLKWGKKCKAGNPPPNACCSELTCNKHNKCT